MDVLTKLRTDFIPLTDGATVTINLAKGNKFNLDSSSSRTLGVPSNVAQEDDGDVIIVRFKNTHGSTNQTLTLETSGNDSWGFTDSVSAITATPAGKTDQFVAIYSWAARKFLIVGYSKQP